MRQSVVFGRGVESGTPWPSRRAWLARLAALRVQGSTGQTGSTVGQIFDEDRGD